ncbi:antibiotic biosynthesis monooxygenase [Taibaiella koreensis]|uniref:antibiotic biosynthesis monooxygenase n=1 Tax=Taibaiella koreensis TaxID=1268548 RepID=UPI000E59C813|nr:antibiotic biosynthesis monooxygenase [Taibaiella koreensis]
MITVQVTYTVKPEFALQNKQNIQRFLVDFRKMDATAFWYHISVMEDGVTFLHFSTYRDEQIQQEVLNTPSFKAFQKERDDSGLNGSHAVRVLQFVGASNDKLLIG